MFPDFREQLRRDEPWVAELVGTDGSGRFVRRFVRGHRDYHEADALGERGIFKNFLLRDGALYEVREQLSWISHRRFLCRVSAGKIVEISKDEALACLSARSALTF